MAESLTMTSNHSILYDGWPLSRAPLSPPSLHLLDTLAIRPGGLDYHIALPDAGPFALPDGLTLHVVETPDSVRGQLRWEQRILPRVAGSIGAALHLTTTTAPLFTRSAALVSPAGDGERPGSERSLTNLLRTSLGRGGTSNSRILWPADLPAPPEVPRTRRISRSPHPAFTPHEFFLPPEIEGAPSLPGTFYLVHIRPDKDAIRSALEAWTWAAGPVGETYPLLFLDLPQTHQDFTLRQARELRISEETLLFYPAVPPDTLHLLYQAASAVFHPQPSSPWGNPLQYGLACGAPVVALETAVSSGIAGPAAYLVPDQDPRSMGSALIAVVVKDPLRKQLADAALERTAAWSAAEARAGLEAAYGEVPGR